NLTLTKVVAELSQEIGRSPTIAEIAVKVHLSEEEVLEGLDTSNAYAVVSLDAPAGGEDTPSVSEHIGVEDESLEALEYRAALGPLIAGLPERERRILYLRFFGGMTQSQIAARLGISQMHVSRLLNRTLAALRAGLLADEETE
ncbi:MAG TPA: sigma-70 family RNA polymerase sigma factor, partial [Actinomycetota bacterium]|nr:sigma-70 family RNA polymerase sigma factor [Actinomycetota bacterium]